MERVFLMQVLVVGSGGFIGSALRYAVGVWIQRALPAAQFPWATLSVNVIGCFLIGLLAAWRQPLEPGLRLFLMVGILGGFTTFSTFALETVALTQADAWGLAASNVAVKLILGLGGAWLGFALGRLLTV